MYSRIVFLFLIILFAGCGGVGTTPEEDEAQLQTSINKVFELSISDPDSALALIDRIVDELHIKPYTANQLRGDVYYNSRRLTSALGYYNLSLEDEDLPNEERLLLLFNIINVNLLLGNDKQAERLIVDAMRDARERGDLYSLSLGNYHMGRLLDHSGERVKAEEYTDQAIRQMEQFYGRAESDNDKIVAATELCAFYLDKMATLCMEEDYEQTLSYCDKLEGIVGEQDDSLTDPAFVYYLRTNLAAKAYALLNLNRKAEADAAYQQWKELPESSSSADPVGYIGPYLMVSGRYDEAKLLYASKIERLEADSMLRYSSAMRTCKKDIARVYEQLGQYRLAYDNLSEAYVIGDTIYERGAKSHSQELEALYQSELKESQLQKERHRIVVREFWLFILALIVLGSVVAIFLFVRNQRIMKKKNLVLSHHIAENVVFKEKYMALVHSHLTDTVVDEMGDFGDRNPEEGRVSRSTDDIAAITDHEEMFRRLSDVIVYEKLFLDSNFSRQTLIDRFGVSKERLGAAFTQGSSEHSSLPDYINNLRLEYSCRLLTQFPEKPINDVATESGFSLATSFNRRFKAKFALSPSEYRALHSKPTPPYFRI